MVIDKVRQMSVIDRYFYMVKERESIRLKRTLGVEKPWTDDEILRSYRFCNMRRMDDKVSQWLLDHWYKPYKNHYYMLPAVAVARFVNNPESLKVITKIVFDMKAIPTWRAGLIVDELRTYRDKGNTVFNGAYMVRGNDGIDKIDCVLNYYVEPLVGLSIYRESMERTWETILPSFGMGSFMAGQIVADLRWAVTGRWGDRKLWAPMGPGSKRGMNRLLERPLKEPMSQATFLDDLQRLMRDAESHVNSTFYSRMEAMDWQNTLCEFDKYERALQGEGKPKQKYPGGVRLK